MLICHQLTFYGCWKQHVCCRAPDCVLPSGDVRGHALGPTPQHRVTCAADMSAQHLVVDEYWNSDTLVILFVGAIRFHEGFVPLLIHMQLMHLQVYATCRSHRVESTQVM